MDSQLNFENSRNYYEIQKESLSNQIFAQNHCFTAIIEI
ncbi:hypothetical protein LEP1GSC172_1885 [Leptospira noguchii]|uniref:Uncharacterized protein n=2 Tax=Leptospira noguchii TaxID=28182 RepID=T0GLF0_9LEPT|nr:hypothetical protein LEP1GSC172_1885 [Leptospira noguchii]EQA69687.1 hypothetical protein LEP1GSC059_1823 [Leptospira noguchii serovar Panama str. CZ214]